MKKDQRKRKAGRKTGRSAITRCLLLFLLLAAAVLPAFGAADVPVFADASGSPAYVTDQQGLLTQEEADQLAEACGEFAKKYDCNIFFVSAGDPQIGENHTEEDDRTYLENFNEQNFGAGSDSIGLLVDMDLRYYYIDIMGDQALQAFTDQKQAKLQEAVEEELAQGIPVFELEKAMQENTDEKKLQEIRRNMIMTDPLYVIFTSGSTGKPKGVITSHQSLICYIESYVSVMEIDENDRLGNQSPLDYIAAIRDIYVPLYKGCSSVIIPKEYFMEPNRLFDYMNEHKVTSVGWSVSAFTVALSLGAFEEVKLNTLKKICFSGSVMPASCLSVWQQNLPDAKFVNQYGPTEATASCTYYEVDHLVSQDEQLPIGRPYNNYRVFLLNEDLTETQNGEIGEICVSGPTLALGYYNDPERTEKSFIINPNYKGYPERMYRTGDYGRIREDGLLEFHGRKDRQVKHMGHRVELDEIEYAANQIAGVDECVSLYNKEKEVLYLFYSGEAAMRQVVLELRKVLPGFMVPRKVKQVSALPKLASGKIDMTKLKEKM